VLINDRTVKLALMDYELRRQKFLQKSVTDAEIEA
jgi:hypothetical protein